jgi:thiol-disulfide isomerase/thioredoxin
MKKTLIVIAILAVIVAGAHFADKATRLPRTASAAKVADAGAGAAAKDAPELSLKDLDGKEVSLAQYKGKVVLVNFWATWCEPCKVEIPWLNNAKSQMNYPIVIGNDAAADKFGGLLGYPTSVLVGRDGKILKRITGLISYDEISKTIESQL